MGRRGGRGEKGREGEEEGRGGKEERFLHFNSISNLIFEKEWKNYELFLQSTIEPKLSDTEGSRELKQKSGELKQGSGEWKQAFESLREEFLKFKEELKEDMRILTDDLDSERKKNAQLSIDIDRLKKTAGYRERLQ